MQTKEQARQQIINFKNSVKNFSGNHSIGEWSSDDDKMFDFIWLAIQLNQLDFEEVWDCSFADCTHFAFIFKHGLLDFTIESPEQSDIWACPHFIKSDSFN